MVEAFFSAVHRLTNKLENQTFKFWVKRCFSR